MADNILDSYLVKLGATVDTPSWNKFDLAILGGEKKIQSFSSKAVKDFLGIEIAAMSAFATIGTGLISLADKTAMADQQYRLFGLRMLMGKDTARAFQMSLDELGATIDEVAYDPELNSRFQYLYEQNIRLGKALGGKNFDDATKKIRDIRMEFNLLEKGLEILAAGSVTKLFDKLGFGTGNLENDFHKLNDWFIDNIPHWSDVISTKLVPVWNTFVGELKDGWDIAKELGHEFTVAVGEISGDKSLQTGTTNFHQFATAVSDTIGWLAKFIDYSLRGAKAALLLGETMTYAYRHPSKVPDFTVHHDKNGKPYLSIFGGGADDTISQKFSDLLASPIGSFGVTSAPSNTTGYSSNDIGSLIVEASKKYNLNPNLLSALISKESNYNSGAISPKGAMGLTQLMRGTADQYGASNPFDASQNIDAGAHYLSDLLKRYNNNTQSALAAYNEGQGNFDKYGISPRNTETRDYVDTVIRKFIDFSARSKAEGGAVHIDNVTIVVPKNLPDQDWHHFVKDSMKDILGNNDRNVMAQTAGGPYF